MLRIRVALCALLALTASVPAVLAEEPMLTPLDNATLKEIAERHAGEGALVFTESRDYPIRRLNGVPARWLPQVRAQAPAFAGTTRPGEFYVFQIGVYALEDIGPLRVSFSGLKGQSGVIPASALRCLSLGGTNQNGQPFLKDVNVRKGGLQALWIGVDVPQAASGTYTGTAQVSFGAGQQSVVPLSLDVAGTPVADYGDSAARNLSRLRWLDSNVGREATLTKGFTPVQAKGRTLKVLGRELLLGEDGLPRQIVSRFSAASSTRTWKPTGALTAPGMAGASRPRAGWITPASVNYDYI